MTLPLVVPLYVMPFLSAYSYDVFVSYAHGPEPLNRYSGDQKLSLLSGWTHRFVDHVIEQINYNLGQVEAERGSSLISSFMDPDLEGNGSLTENLKEKARESALFLSVMSPFYLKSSWCTDEIGWFLSGIPGENPELRHLSRIFVARIAPTDHNAWPENLKDAHRVPTRGYFFHPKGGGSDHGVPYGWPCPDERDREYWSEVRRLAADITAKLRRLKALETTPRSGAKVAAVEPAIGRQVFLGYMHDTLLTTRNDLRRELTNLGLQVLPPENDDAWDEASLRERLDRYLGQAHVMALCANQYCGTWPPDQNGGFVSLQMEKAKERNIPCQLWLSWDQVSEPPIPRYKGFLQAVVAQSKSSSPSLRIDHRNAQEFAQYVKEAVNQDKVIPAGIEQLAVVCSNLHADEDVYRRFHDAVTTAISETDRGSLLLSFDDPTGHIRLKDLEKDITRADTIVVICFDQEWQWAMHVMREIRQLMKADSAKGVRLLLIGPQAEQGISFDSRAFRFTTLNAYGMEEAHLRELLKGAILKSKDGGEGADTRH